MKFSIIVPVYNVENYLEKCLKSISEQTFKDFEAIVVNDGTIDNSQKIIDKYVKDFPEIFKSYIKTNGGLSDARNFGINKSKGDYIVFLDGDDWFDYKLLEALNNVIEKNESVELIRIPKKTIIKNEISVEKQVYKKLTGQEAFLDLRKDKKCIETAWSYCISSKYWDKNDFKFPKDKFHEDFGTMIIVLLKAEKVVFIESPFYNYIVRENSIMTNKNYEKEKRKAYDKIYHYDNILKELEKCDNFLEDTRKVCLEYISTALCFGIKELKKEDRRSYKKELKNRNILKNITFKNLREVMRKVVLWFMVNL